MSNWFRTYGFADVLDGLLVGAYPLDAADVAILSALGIKHVLNMAEDQEYRRGEREVVGDALRRAGIEEHRVSLPDFGGLPSPVLETAVRDVSGWLDAGLRVYVHCRAGWQRSAALAAGVIAARQGIDVDEALDRVKARKPSADPLPHQREDLRRWWQERGAQAAWPAEQR
jgi:protein-tyrosine phosphatase